MKNVMFVDDEPRVIDALRRMLRDQRDAWRMEFALSGEEALRRVEAEPFDVIVSDMRMPGMDGAQLLERVVERSPQTVRIILSGQADRDNVLRSVGPTHQFLAKPCDAEVLKSTVKRACNLRDRLADGGLVQLVSRIRTLPSLPSMYTQLLAELQTNGGSLTRVGEIISQDVAMTAKILQLVNSSFFGLPRAVSTPIHATKLLGLETIKALVFSASVFSQFDAPAETCAALNRAVEHSFQVGMCAKAISKQFSSDSKLVDEAFMAGVLHDVGQLVLMTNLAAKYEEVKQSAELDQLPTWRMEKSAFGADHGTLGAYLMGLWGLPDTIVETVAFHHYPNESPGEQFSPLTAVHIADAFCHAEATADEVPELDGPYLERVGVADRIDSWRESCRSISKESPT